MVGVGDTVSDFSVEAARGDELLEITLSEYADGRPTALVFYVHDFSPVCEAQMCEVNDTEFLTFNEDVRVLGVSTDGPYSHRKFIQENDLSYPLLYDVDKEIYEEFGMLAETADGRRHPKRGIVLIDGERTVRYWWQAEDNWDTWRTDPIADLSDTLNDLGAF